MKNYDSCFYIITYGKINYSIMLFSNKFYETSQQPTCIDALSMLIKICI